MSFSQKFPDAKNSRYTVRITFPGRPIFFWLVPLPLQFTNQRGWCICESLRESAESELECSTKICQLICLQVKSRLLSSCFSVKKHIFLLRALCGLPRKQPYCFDFTCQDINGNCYFIGPLSLAYCFSSDRAQLKRAISSWRKPRVCERDISQTLGLRRCL